jgi:hypothetical protein
LSFLQGGDALGIAERGSKRGISLSNYIILEKFGLATILVAKIAGAVNSQQHFKDPA